MIVITLLRCAVVFVSMCAAAAFAEPLGKLTQWQETLVVDAVLGSPARKNFWGRSKKLVIASEELRRAGLLARCDALRSPAEWPMLDPRYRKLVEDAAVTMEQRTSTQNTQAARLYQARVELWQAAKLDRKNFDQLFDQSDAATKRAIQIASVFSTLKEFSSVAHDATFGKSEPAAIVWLMDFLKAEGEFATFVRAFEKVIPEKSGSIKKIQALNSYSQADGSQLVQLGDLIADLITRGDLGPAWLDELQSADREAFQRWSGHPFFTSVVSFSTELKKRQLASMLEAMKIAGTSSSSKTECGQGLPQPTGNAAMDALKAAAAAACTSSSNTESVKSDMALTAEIEAMNQAYPAPMPDSMWSERPIYKRAEKQVQQVCPQ